MHELSLCESIVSLVTDCAAREGVTRVTRVTIDIGAASAVDPDALLFCFPLVTEGTPAASAVLCINHIALKAHCIACGTDYAPATLISPCPACGGHDRSLLAGRDMRVVSFEGE
ncbi:hydrogenase expression protein HupH [Azospirillum sp. TSH100]|uniref:hydrogenase maturation nickel metallochaperone HypA n=1 Tax=Azospirillum sp. TSH100 TaxID=652764 RepID=UPI000D614681|nr:hydrogenase maturation nickel metallochaperone HypA [Azospirillum sp. TSH100]PWC90894.1 hydrogenase expression protein HupH [Azospirillum sp. TSH100]QCG90744.1 hydrogenase maturation nickel metallochaperone HypA [Azospirillum sp. TSH100]